MTRKALFSALLLLCIFPAIFLSPISGQAYTTVTGQFTTSLYSYSTEVSYHTQTLTTSWSSTQTATFTWAYATGYGACLAAAMTFTVPVTQTIRIQVTADQAGSFYLLSFAQLSDWIQFMASASALNLNVNPCMPPISILSADLMPRAPRSFDATLQASKDPYSLFFISRLKARVIVEVSALAATTLAVTQTMQLTLTQVSDTVVVREVSQSPIELLLGSVAMPVLAVVLVAALALVGLLLRSRRRQPGPTSKKFCVNCGAELPSDSLFCLQCGEKAQV